MNHPEPWWLDVADFEAGLQSKSLATLDDIVPTDSAPVEIDPVERALLLIQLARVARDRGDQASDLTYWRESLRLSEELDDFEWVTYRTAGLGLGALRSGNYAAIPSV